MSSFYTEADYENAIIDLFQSKDEREKPCRRIAEKAHCGADTYLPPHECGKVGEIL